jgi:hypothetical protein
LRLTQFRVSRAINTQFAAYGTRGEGIIHRNIVPQVKGGRIPLSPKVRQSPAHLL